MGLHTPETTGPIRWATVRLCRRLIVPTELEAFEMRCWARARLYAEGELDLFDAVDKLQADAERRGLVAEPGQDAVQAIIAAAFRAVRAREPLL